MRERQRKINCTREGDRCGERKGRERGREREEYPGIMRSMEEGG